MLAGACTLPGSGAATSPSPGAATSTPASSPSSNPTPVNPLGVLFVSPLSGIYTVSLVGIDGRVVASAQANRPVDLHGEPGGNRRQGRGERPGQSSGRCLVRQRSRRRCSDAAQHQQLTGVLHGRQGRRPLSGGQRRCGARHNSARRHLDATQLVHGEPGRSTNRCRRDRLHCEWSLDEALRRGSQRWRKPPRHLQRLWPLHPLGHGMARHQQPCGGESAGLQSERRPFLLRTAGISRGGSHDGCATTQANVLTWTAGAGSSFDIPGNTPAYLSPDGQQVAIVSTADPTTTLFPSKTTVAVVACGWIDNSHLLTGGDTQRQPRVTDVSSGKVVPVAATGECAGRIPGGL